MGPIFTTEEDKKENIEFMSPKEYDRIIDANPELAVHPEHMTIKNESRNRHFKIVSMPTQSSDYNLGTMGSEYDMPN